MNVPKAILIKGRIVKFSNSELAWITNKASLIARANPGMNSNQVAYNAARQYALEYKL